MPSNRLFISNSSFFPDNLDGFTQVVPLGGGTMSTFSITHPQKGTLVLKVGTHADALKLEVICKELYRALGVLTPEAEVYNSLPDELAKRIGVKSPNGTFLVSRFIAGTKTKDRSKAIIKTAQQSFVAHVLLGNIDIAKEDQFTTDQDDNIYLVDAGANFLFRALGKERDQLPDGLTELDSLRDSSINPTAHEWFSSLSPAEIHRQATATINQLPQLEKLLWDISWRLQVSEALRAKMIEDFATRCDTLVHRCQVDEQAGALIHKKTSSEQTAAGIFTYAKDNNQTLVLLSKRVGHEWWDTLGGKSDAGDETLADTACREVFEESGKVIKTFAHELHRCPFHDLVTEVHNRSFVYRMYFKEHPIFDPDNIQDNEHTDHLWVNAQDLLDAVQTYNAYLTLPTGQSILLYTPLFEMLSQKPVLAHLQHLANGQPLKLTHTQGRVHQTEQPLKRIFTTPTEKWRNITQVMMQQKEVCADIREVMAVREVWQNRHQAKQIEVAAPQIPSLSMSQSEVHMRSVLQNKYVAGDPATNVRTMFETYFAKGVARGVKEPLIEQLIDFIKREQQLGDEQVFVYHAANDVIAFAYEVYTKLYQALMAKERHEVFRAQGHYFKPFANMAEFMAHYSQNHTQDLNNYAQGFNECALSTNLFLFGNHRDDASCSVRYLLTNFVNRGSVLKNILMDLFRKYRIPQALIEGLLQFHAQSAKNNHGILYQIAIPKKEATQWTYSASSGGRLNPHPQQRDCHDVSVILDYLREGVEDDPKSNEEYIQKLQVRVFVPPQQNFMTHKIRVSHLKEDQQNDLAKELTKLIDEIAVCILRGLSGSNREHLDPDLALFKLLPTVAAANQLAIKSNTLENAEIDLVHAVLANDDTTVVELVTAWPALLTRKVTNPDYNNFFRNDTRSEKTSMALVDFILLRSSLSSNTMVRCFGDQWSNSLNIKNYYELENALKKIPDESRMAFACRHQQHVRTQENLISIIDLLPENQRLNFAKNHVDKIQRTIGTLNLIENLPPTQRFDFFQSLPDAVTNLPDLAFALRAFTEAEKLLLIEAKAHLLCNGHQLADLLDNIESTARYSVACKYADCIQDTHELRNVLQKLQPTTQTAFANLNKELINQPEDLSEVAQGLPEDERHPFALGMKHKLCTSDVVFRMIGMVLPAERSYYFPLLEKYLKDIYALQLLLKYSPQAQWLEVIERNINKINVNFNGFMTNFFDTYCPNECPPTLAKLFQKQRDSDGVSDFIGFIRDIKRLNVSVYLSAFQITVVNIEQILAILKRTPTAQQLQFLGQYDSIIFADANNIIQVLDVLHESHRATYVLAVAVNIPANEKRLAALARLPAEQRLGYVAADPNWFAWSPSLTDEHFVSVMKLLPTTQHLALSEQHALVNNTSRLAFLLPNRPLDQRLILVERYLSLIQNGKDLSQIIPHLTRPYGLELAGQSWPNLAEKTDLAAVVRALPNSERLSFIRQCNDYITDETVFAELAVLLADEDLRGFVNENERFIQSGGLVVTIASQLPAAAQRGFLDRYLPQFQTAETVVAALKQVIPTAERLAYAVTYRVESYSSITLAALLTLLANDQEREQFLAKIPSAFNSCNLLAAAIPCFAKAYRFEFAKKHLTMVQSAEDMVLILPFIPEKIRLEFLSTYLHNIQTLQQVLALAEIEPRVTHLLYPDKINPLIKQYDDLSQVIKHVLPSCRYQFISSFLHLIENGAQLRRLMNGLNDRELLLIATKMQHCIQDPKQLASVIRCLPRESHKSFVRAQSHKFVDFNFLIEFMQAGSEIYLNLNLHLAQCHHDKIKTADDFALVFACLKEINENSLYLIFAMKTLPDSIYLPTLEAYVANVDQLGKLIGCQGYEQRAVLAYQLQAYVTSCAHLCAVLDQIRSEDCFAYAVSKAHLVKTKNDLEKVLRNLPNDQASTFTKEHAQHIPTEPAVASKSSIRPSRTIPPEVLIVPPRKIETPSTEADLVDVLEQIKDGKDRLSYAQQHVSSINNDELLSKILNLLPEPDRFVFARSCYAHFSDPSEFSKTYFTLPVLQRHAFWYLASAAMTLDDNLYLFKTKTYGEVYDFPCHFNLFAEEDRIRLAEAYGVDSNNLRNIVSCLAVNERYHFLQARAHLITTEEMVSELCPLVSSDHRYAFVEQYEAYLRKVDSWVAILGSLSVDERRLILSRHQLQVEYTRELLAIFAFIPDEQKLNFLRENLELLKTSEQLITCLQLLPINDRSVFLRFMLGMVTDVHTLTAALATLPEAEHQPLLSLIDQSLIDNYNRPPKGTSANNSEYTEIRLSESDLEQMNPAIRAIYTLPEKERLDYAFTLIPSIKVTSEVTYILRSLAPLERSAWAFVPLSRSIFGEVCIPVILRTLSGFYREQFAKHFFNQITREDILCDALALIPKEGRLNLVAHINQTLRYSSLSTILPYFLDGERKQLVEGNSSYKRSIKTWVALLLELPLEYRLDTCRRCKESIETIEDVVDLVRVLPNNNRFIFVFEYYHLLESIKQLNQVIDTLSAHEADALVEIWQNNHPNENVLHLNKKTRLAALRDGANPRPSSQLGLFAGLRTSEPDGATSSSMYLDQVNQIDFLSP